MTALSSFQIYCLDIIKIAKLLTREMSRAPVNNCFFFFSYKTVFFKNDNWRVYGVFWNKCFYLECWSNRTRNYQTSIGHNYAPKNIAPKNIQLTLHWHIYVCFQHGIFLSVFVYKH